MAQGASETGSLTRLQETLLPPLRFASKDGFARVSRLSGFESLALAALERARGDVDDALARALSDAARGFDSAPEDERKARARHMLAVLDAQAPAPATDALALPVSALPGVGPKRREELAARGFHTLGDLLYTLPRTYEDRRATRRIADLERGTIAAVSGTVVASGASGFGGRGRRYEVALDDGSGHLRLVFFHFRLPEMQKRFARGAVVTAAGEVQSYGPRMQMVHPKVHAGARVEELGGIHPVYPEIQGMHPLELARTVRAALERAAGGVVDPLPAAIRARVRVPPLHDAFTRIHDPPGAPSDEELRALVERRTEAHKRLAFEELFVLATALALRRRSAQVEPAPALAAQPDEPPALARLLPFTPTKAQANAIADIGADLSKPVPMARLLQGDVGAGKTAVAAAACLRAVRAKHQAAFMAPTELLAEQHARTLKKLFSPLGIRVELVTGSLGKKARALVEARLKNHDVDIAVGTQALLSEGVTFARLGLCVVDEQHRFGVVQRAALRDKGALKGGQRMTPHLLVMTATPIPRSLALTLYGDLAVSILDELPPGRTPVATRAVRDADATVTAVADTLAKGERAFVVYPLIEESAALDLATATSGFEELSQRFPGETAIVHGKMSSAERDRVMARFRGGDVRVLVSTTVVEVGVDVPDATLMVIQHAERFGLAQLHQLRGRVGRSARPSQCLLVTAGAGPDALARVQALVDTNDGFRIADEDLKLRGAGDVLGTRQSGMPSLAFSDLVRHVRLIEVAREIAGALVDDDPRLERPEHAGLRKLVFERYAARLALAAAG